MSRPAVDPRANLLAAAEAQADDDPVMAALLRELDEAVSAAERRGSPHPAAPPFRHGRKTPAREAARMNGSTPTCERCGRPDGGEVFILWLAHKDICFECATVAERREADGACPRCGKAGIEDSDDAFIAPRPDGIPRPIPYIVCGRCLTRADELWAGLHLKGMRWVGALAAEVSKS
jgi:hypothetical protein